MRENINKVSQRGERLDALQDKTDNLAVSAQGFRRGANRVRKQMWWKDMKMRVCLIAVIIILIVVIVVPAGAFFLCFAVEEQVTDIYSCCSHRDQEIISAASDSSARRHFLGPGSSPMPRSSVRRDDIVLVAEKCSFAPSLWNGDVSFGVL